MGMILQMEDGLPYICFLGSRIVLHRRGMNMMGCVMDMTGCVSGVLCEPFSSNKAYVQTTSNLVLCMEPHRDLFCARGSNLEDYEFGAVESADEKRRDTGKGKELCQPPAPELTPFRRMDRRTQE